MHKKTILITLCCASLILVTPFTTVAQENTVSNNVPEQPKDVEGLVAQLRVAINEILQKYGHIPSIAKQCGIILNLIYYILSLMVWVVSLIIWVISLIIWVISLILYIPFLIGWVVYCGIIIIIAEILGIFIDYAIYNHLHNLEDFLLSIGLIFVGLYFLGGCYYDDYNLLHNIPSLRNINNKTNLTKDCPCLQE
jgi:hypothetical protein